MCVCVYIINEHLYAYICVFDDTWSQMTTGAVSGFSSAGKNQKNMFPLLAESTVRKPA